MSKYIQVTLHLNKEFADAIREIADREGESVSTVFRAFVRSALHGSLRKSPFSKIRLNKGVDFYV